MTRDSQANPIRRLDWTTRPEVAHPSGVARVTACGTLSVRVADPDALARRIATARRQMLDLEDPMMPGDEALDEEAGEE